MDRKIRNIMEKLNSRFDRESHRAKNEEMVSKFRMKAAQRQQQEFVYH